MPLQLALKGYDVWMGNNRSSRYSNVNKLYPFADQYDHPDYAEQNFKKYDFSWLDMGDKDLPAMIDAVLEISQKPKITYVGFSQGTEQFLYGLMTMEDSYFADRVHKGVLMAPCPFPIVPDFESYKER